MHPSEKMLKKQEKSASDFVKILSAVKGSTVTMVEYYGDDSIVFVYLSDGKSVEVMLDEACKVMGFDVQVS